MIWLGVVFIALLITDAVVFPITVAKKTGSVLRGVGFAVYTAVLIFAAIAAFFGFMFITVSVFNLPQEFFIMFIAPVLNIFYIIAVNLLTKKLKFIDGTGKRILYSLLTAACSAMGVISWVLFLWIGSGSMSWPLD